MTLDLPVRTAAGVLRRRPGDLPLAWRRWVFRRVGGVIPIWPGGGREAIETHLAAATAALDAGAVLCLFPERGPATPPGTARPLGLGVAYFALRTGAPIVPIVLGGTHDLYRGRRFRMESSLR